MVLPDAIQSQVSFLDKRLETCINNLNTIRTTKEYEGYEKVRDQQFILILKDICAVVHETEASNGPHCLELSKAAHQILNKVIEYTYGDGGLFDFMPSWAHDDSKGRPLIKDHDETILPGTREALLAFIIACSSAQDALTKLKVTPWDDSMKRHLKSTPLARFRPTLPNLTATPTNPLAMNVFDARCEISSTRIASPIRLQVSLGGNCLALTGMTGYKNRSPALEYLLLDKPEHVDFSESHYLQAGLADIAYHMDIDESRQLIFLGDNRRVKSYSWGTLDGTHYKKPLPTHTLDSNPFSGPIVVLPSGTLVRAGKGRAGVWNISGLETHGESGEEIIGEELDFEDLDSWRDDPEDIELSIGSAASSNIEFVDQPDLKPNIWQPLIGAPSTVLCVEYARDSSNYGCTSIDLETGKTVMCYLGHGATVSDFSVSSGDPHVFLTACHDGFARMFDVRQSLPVLTFDACRQSEFCDTAALAHVDGIPIVFTGTQKYEQIKVWDVRARTAVYELATGNNAVQSLAWDAKHNCLYAATECSYMDRMGYHHEYRRAKIPRPKTSNSSAMDTDEGEDDGDDMDEDDYDDYDDYERCWPKKAYHGEDYFGYVFDAGDHRIYRYAFKEEPDMSVLPEYGNATIGGGW